MQRAGQHSQRMCLGAADRLSQVWEPNDAPEPRPRRATIQQAFLTIGGRYALETWDRVSVALDRYASQWRAAYANACEATHVRGEQSAEVLDLRMTCLRERLGQLKALTDIFETADEPVVVGAVEAVLALGRIERCADVALLREVVPPPQDENTRAAVEALRSRFAVVKALRDAGRYREGLVAGAELVTDARAVGYKPLLAEALFILGSLQWQDGDSLVYETSLTEAIWAAEASHHDEVKANATGFLAGMVLRPEEAERWGRLAEATSERMGPGHEWVQAWVLTGRSAVRNRQGDFQAAAGFARQAISIKKKILQPEDPDVAYSLNNLAVALTGLGDYDGALSVIDGALAILKHAYGDRSAWVAMCMSNRGETLNAKGAYAEARTELDLAVSLMREQYPVDHRILAYPLTALGQSELAMGDARAAVGTLERALVIREGGEPDQLLVAETRFSLARALWEAGRDRARALSLASSAHAAYATSPWATSKLTAVDGWLEPRCPARNCSR